LLADVVARAVGGVTAAAQYLDLQEGFAFTQHLELGGESRRHATGQPTSLASISIIQGHSNCRFWI
jgi:hypothetical protein